MYTKIIVFIKHDFYFLINYSLFENLPFKITFIFCMRYDKNVNERNLKYVYLFN